MVNLMLERTHIRRVILYLPGVPDQSGHQYLSEPASTCFFHSQSTLSQPTRSMSGLFHTGSRICQVYQVNSPFSQSAHRSLVFLLFILDTSDLSTSSVSSLSKVYGLIPNCEEADND